MKRVLQIALTAVLSMGAVTMQAQDNWHGDRDGRDRIAHFNNGRNGRHDDRRDSRDDSAVYVSSQPACIIAGAK